MKILIGGDFHISDAFRGRAILDPSILTFFDEADYRILNLEAPITAGRDSGRVFKTGPHLCATPDTVLPVLEKLRIDLITLANNHLMDFGLSGLDDTLTSLQSQGISTVGAGRNLTEASRPFLLDREGFRLAVLNFAENEWASAGRDRPGANPLDVIENAKQIQEVRKMCEIVIVIIHGGYEHSPLPSPHMVRHYHYYVENGASAIVGHHPHCLSGFEVYQGALICYSLGNFVFTQPSIFDSWYTGLVLNLSLRRGAAISWDLVPVGQSKRGFTVTRLTGKPKDDVVKAVEAYSDIISDEALLAQRWESFLSDWQRYYLNVFSPLNAVRNRHLKGALIKLGLDRLFIGKEHYAQILNHVRCDAHLEASRGVIERFLGSQARRGPSRQRRPDGER